MSESEEELKSLLKVKEESETVGLKLNIQITKIMASGPITSWEIDGEAVETVSDFIFWDSKITADGDCSHEIERRLLNHLMQRVGSLEKTMMLGGIRGRRRRGRQRMRWLDGITDLMDVGVGDGQGVLGAITGDPTHDKVM